MIKHSVSVDMIDAIQAQTELFSLIKEFVPKISPEILGQDVVVQYNFWRTTRYRSVLLTLDVQEAENKRKYPYGWHIYYNSPLCLVFVEKLRNPDKWEDRLSVDLANEFYFELSDDEKRKVILDFVRNYSFR